jgi:hypothetical protein
MIQYPKHEHMTLGSVENWGSNTNILRDPPKSIFTRRIDKVGQNTDITELIDSSDDRAAEGINVYARGVNPMVSVSYNNQSNNAGISGNPTATSGKTQAFLPYTIMNEGAFRPPVRNPRDLIPLSRLPRVWFSANALPSAVDYSKTKQQPSNYRAVKDASDMVKAFDIRPNQSANISVKSLEHFRSNPKTAINERHINVSASAGIKERDTSWLTKVEPTLHKELHKVLIICRLMRNDIFKIISIMKVIRTFPKESCKILINYRLTKNDIFRMC